MRASAPPVWTPGGSAWNPSDKGSSISLTNSDYTATGGSSFNVGVRGALSKTSGKHHLEFRRNGSGGSPYAGIADANQSVSAGPGGSSIRFWSGGELQRGGTNLGNFTAWADGEIIGFEIDIDAGQLWFIKDGARNGPYATTGVNFGGLFPYFNAGSSSGSVTLNTGGIQTIAVTAGFAPWG